MSSTSPLAPLASFTGCILSPKYAPVAANGAISPCGKRVLVELGPTYRAVFGPEKTTCMSYLFSFKLGRRSPRSPPNGMSFERRRRVVSITAFGLPTTRPFLDSGAHPSCQNHFPHHLDPFPSPSPPSLRARRRRARRGSALVHLGRHRHPRRARALAGLADHRERGDRHRARHPQDRQRSRRPPARAGHRGPIGGDGGEALPRSGESAVPSRRRLHRRPGDPQHP